MYKYTLHTQFWDHTKTNHRSNIDALITNLEAWHSCGCYLDVYLVLQSSARLDLLLPSLILHDTDSTRCWKHFSEILLHDIIARLLQWT